MPKYILLLFISTILFKYAHNQVPTIVKDIKVNGDADISEITSCNGKLFFTANDGTGSSAWVTDGTAGNTISLNTNGGRDYNEYNGKTYFIAKDNNGYEQLWVTDGTPIGTSQLKEINDKGHAVGNIYTVAGNKLFFRGIDSLHGNELWITNGTENGTYLIGDINPGTAGSIVPTFESYGVYNHRLFFAANDGENGNELWVSDGYQGGAFMYKNISSGFTSSNPNNFKTFNNRLYFAATASYTGREIWFLDDSINYAHYINITDNGGTNPESIVEYNNKMYFIGGPPSSTKSLYETRGTNATTYRLIDSVSNIVVFDNHIYFAKAISILSNLGYRIKYELYKTDGQGNISPISTLSIGNSSTAPYNFTVCNGKLYFLQKWDLGLGTNYTVNDLRVHDPILNTTNLIMSSANPGNEALVFTNTGITAYNDAIYFKGKEEEGEELYRLGNVSVGVEDINESNNLIIYPNPANNMIVVRISTAAMLYQLSITNINGQVVYENMDLNDTIQYIDLSNVPVGMYMIKVRDSKGIQSIKRFIKQ